MGISWVIILLFWFWDNQTLFIIYNILAECAQRCLGWGLRPSIGTFGRVSGPSAEYRDLRPSIGTFGRVLGPFGHVMGPSSLISPLALRSKNGTVFHQPIKKKYRNFFLPPGRTISGSRGYHMPNFRSLGATVWACIEHTATHTHALFYIYRYKAAPRFGLCIKCRDQGEMPFFASAEKLDSH